MAMLTVGESLEALEGATAAPGPGNHTPLTTPASTAFVPRSALNYADLDNYWAYRTALDVSNNKYYFFVPFSLICNIFSFVVLFKRITKGSAYMLMANVAIWDAAAIFVKGLMTMVFIHAWDIGDTGCTIVSLFVYLFSPIAVWLVVLLTIDRVIAVWFPFKYRQLCSMPRALMAYVFVVVMMLCVCVNHFWVVYGVSVPPYYFCMFKPKYDEQTERFFWAYLAFESFIPTALMIMLNAALIYRVRRTVSRSEEAENPDAGGKSTKMSAENHVTLMALSIAVSFVLLTGPFCGLNAALALRLWDYDKDLDTYVTYAVTLCVVHLLYDLNHCLNVFFYFWSSRKFRSEALQLLTCGRRGGKKDAQTTGGGKGAASGVTSVSAIVSEGG